jgi:hypothetical protein
VQGPDGGCIGPVSSWVRRRASPSTADVATTLAT